MRSIKTEHPGEADLALVIPCYDEERRLPKALERLERYARESGIALQLIVADDGSNDATRSIAEAFGRRPGIVVDYVRIAHRGKGAAVRAGMRIARAPVVGYCDVDLSAGPDAIDDLYHHIKGGADMAIASRGLPDSVLDVRQPWYREQAGRAFNLVLRKTCRIPYRDTQCGLKLMREEVAKGIFHHQRLDGFAFDAEVVVLAVRLGYSVEEIPIRWTHDDGSKLSLARDSLRMARDIFRIVRRVRGGSIQAPGVPTAQAIDTMASSERTHWWHAAKRRVVLGALDGAGAGPCLDVGCGGGATLAEISRSRAVYGIDLSLRALTHARSRGLMGLVQGDAGALPFATGRFGAVLALDVVEHYTQPEVLLTEIRRVLRPGGTLVVTVPAYQWMWSYADHVLGHYRRYTRSMLTRELRSAGFHVVRATHFHSWLVGPAWLFRTIRSIVGSTSSADDFGVPRPLNGLLGLLTRLELRIMRRRDIPFGLSILAVAKPEPGMRHAEPA